MYLFFCFLKFYNVVAEKSDKPGENCSLCVTFILSFPGSLGVKGPILYVYDVLVLTIPGLQ